ncbi:MAG: HIT domain-containing protein [candidate division Zixibacteria bacterium]|nr:HIT domain-containing protein [candidate division Zixibacteria bacterium]
MADKIMWAPWRSAFILGEREKGCVFCSRPKEEDSCENLIVYRGEKVYVILNKYPYNTGHALVVPYRHIGQVEKLTVQESTELFSVSQKTVAAMKRALNPHGFNLGMNLGPAAGAGIPKHLHMHIVPRWTGDSNFMPIVGQTNVVSIPLEPVYDALRKELSGE